MSQTTNLETFISSFAESIKRNTFIKLSMSNYRGKETDLKNIYVRKIVIKKEDKISFTFHYKTKDIVKNYSIQESQMLIKSHFENGFNGMTLLTLENDIVLEKLTDQNVIIRTLAPSHKELPAIGHDKSKNRMVLPGPKSYLCDLGITDINGIVYPTSQDKYKQIDKYIEIMSSLVKEISGSEINTVLDMGAGKGYLTFALYDYLHSSLKIDASVIGVEARKELVIQSNQVAQKHKFEKLNFVEGTIIDYPVSNIDILVALHACDTATDEAIYKGITSDAKLIVCSPCCHKQIRREMEKSEVTNELDSELRHGVFMERQAEMVTDTIRSLILEYYGYRTKIFEFISDSHTPKNVMIVGVKQKLISQKNEDALAKIKTIKNYFGIGKHHLEELVFNVSTKAGE